MTGEIVSINIGQAGVQFAESCWELYCLEHGVEPDGRMKCSCFHEHKNNRFNSIFYETEKSVIVPRAMFIDLEPTVIDVVRSGKYKSLFHPNTFLSGKEDAANNFARGYYGVGREALEVAVERIEKLAEDCDQLQGFLLSHSLGGGTGSGFTAILAQALSQLFPKKSKINFIVYPSPHLSTSMVEPYNSLLTTHCTMDHSDCSFLLDNEAIYKICHNKLKVSRPMYKNLNQVISHVLSSITTPLRFEGSLQVNLSAFQTNLVPYPRIHFPLATYSPLMTDVNILRSVVSIQHLTNQCFAPHNQMVNCSPQSAKYMACCLLYRGDVSPSKVNYALQNIKRSSKIHFVDWCPTGFKIGINSQPPFAVPGSDIGNSIRAVCMLSNTTAIREAWARLDYKFDLMFRKKAFVHWYISEGMTLDEFLETRENMAALEEDYKEAGAETVFVDEEEPGVEEY
ncbi:tubulin alpha-4 chain [Octopus bimaculoides]|uniref:Tubulin alpha chain n=1 Tax=Octopus bimaculoides TaxID=37653 RepID=A0A0L8H6Q7_OCTBM|nr:tubulin alpha-4 chain [Octopus bimaculoides]|eukprot:XP_014774949.1 PREDICTED: tubulin alpha-4 chain-like [Octopus bimaculoides]